jgi:hypothetical protein
MKFDDREQEPPFWVGTNNLVLRTPFPGVRIKAASLVNKDYLQVFVSGRGTDAIKRFVKRDREFLLDSLPKGTVIDSRGDWQISYGTQEVLSDADKYAWLKKALNAFVNVLRPRLRSWYEEFRK